MKGIVRLSVILSLWFTLAKADAGSKDEQPKQLFNTANAITSQQKPELLTYQQITHFGDKYQPEQVIYQQRYQPRTQHLQQATPYQHQLEPMIRSLVPQHQQTPVAMVIIAQPAYVPISMLQQSNVAQQLLNYFHGNSQARFIPIPIRNPQQPLQQYAPAPLQSQQIPQYVPYQPQQEIAQPQISAPSAQAQDSQVYQHEALPTPQALISPQHIVPHHLPQKNTVEGRALQYNAPQQHYQYQYPQHQYQQHQYTEVQIQQSEEPQLQQTEQQSSSEHQKPVQPTDISQLAQQAAQHFLMNGGLQGGSRTAPAIITGLEHFSPQQQEKIKAQLGVHFGSPLKPLTLGGQQEQKIQKGVVLPSTNYYQDQKKKLTTEKFVPSIEVKDGEITQNTSGSGKM